MTKGLVAGRYRLDSLAGRGGMGEVWKALDTSTGLPVALKRMLVDAEPGRFTRESKLLSSVRHEALVGHVAHGVEAGVPWLAMAWIEGETLASRLDREGMPLGDTLALGRRIAGALSALHAQGIVHRDLKPSNVMLAQQRPDQALVLDLGVARTNATSRRLTATNVILGTVGYMAPEQALSGEVTPAADVFALGCLLFECLTGTPVFSGENAITVLADLLSQRALPRARALCPEVPEALDSLVASMLARDAAKRPRDGAAALAALSALKLTDAALGQIATPALPAKTYDEQTVTLAAVVDLGTVDAGATTASDSIGAEMDRARSAARAAGGEIVPIDAHTALVIGEAHGTVADRAAVVAIVVRAIVAVLPSARVGLAAELANGAPAGDLLERAVELARNAQQGSIALDEITGQLLADRFELANGRLGGPLGGPERDAAPVEASPGKIELKTAPSRISPQAAPQPALGKYLPILELGRGGMATVYLCMLRGLGGFGKLQVVKRLRPEFAEDPEFRSMFLEEARLAARINHVNVVQTNEVGIDGNNLFIAMEHLEGQSLEELIRRAAKNGQPLSLKYYLPILVDALRGLHFAHELKDFTGRPVKLIHRDVSPHNIFVTYDGQVKVVDFGIAKAADSTNETKTGVIKGKAAYMAPEQATARRLVDHRADLFSVGAILWRGLVGKRLWRGMNEMEILIQITTGQIPSPTTEKPDLDPEIVDICMKALARNPEERFASAQHMLDALEGYMAKGHPRATPPEVGALLTELFADRRQEVTAAIERCVTAAEQSGALEGIDVEWDGVHASDVGGATAATSVLPPALDSEATLGNAGASESLPGAVTVRAPAQRRSYMVAIPIVLAIGGAFAWAISATKVDAPVVVAPPSAIPSPTPSSPPPANPVQFQLTLSPPEASVLIDGQPLTATTRFVRDGTVHRVLVTADKYEPETRLVTFDAPTVVLDFALHKTAAKVPTAAVHPIIGPHNPNPITTASAADTAATPPASATTATATPAPTDSSRKIGLDKTNPWGK